MVYEVYKITELEKELEDFSDSSRVWIWQAAIPLDENQVGLVRNELQSFIPKWTSHTLQLKARGLVRENRFIIVCLDQENSSAASGCSIDSLTHALQGIGQKIAVDLFDRNVCYYLSEGNIDSCKLNELGELKSAGKIDERTLIFDPLINSLGRLRIEWPKPIGESWHARFL